jgi:hypothetical protein
VKHRSTLDIPVNPEGVETITEQQPQHACDTCNTLEAAYTAARDLVEDHLDILYGTPEADIPANLDPGHLADAACEAMLDAVALHAAMHGPRCEDYFRRYLRESIKRARAELNEREAA